MRPTAIAGLVLIIVGVIALAYRPAPTSDRERILQAAGESSGIPLQTVLGGVSLAAGVGLVIVGTRKY